MKAAMRFICFILPWMQRSGTPGRSRRNTSYVYFTCLHVDRNTNTFACTQGKACQHTIKPLLDTLEHSMRVSMIAEAAS